MPHPQTEEVSGTGAKRRGVIAHLLQQLLHLPAQVVRVGIPENNQKLRQENDDAELHRKLSDSEEHLEGDLNI